MIVNNEIGVTLCPTSRALELEKQQDQNQTTESWPQSLIRMISRQVSAYTPKKQDETHF